MGGSRGGGRVAATTHQLQQQQQQQQCHNGENHRPVAKVTAAAPALLLSRKKRINVAHSHGLAQSQLSSSSSCPLSWLPFHASLALNLALVYYICLSLSPDRALQHDDHGIRCSSLSNHHHQQQEQQLLHRSPRSAAASPNVFCNNTRLTTSFSRDPWEEPVVLQTDDDDSPCVSCAPAPVLEGSSYVSFSALDHARECSSNGHFVVLDQQQQKKAVGRGRIGACHCHPCFTGPRCAELATNCILNLSIGDPTIFESYWLTLGSQATTVIPAWQGMSYFAHKHNAFLFVDHHLELTIRELHTLVGNAVTQDRYILLGVGSTQLFQAAIYALAANLPENSTPTTSDPIKIVSAVPFYSAYAEAVDYQKSATYKWAGDATKFQQVAAAGEGGGGRNHDRAASFIEVVTSPSNPEGSICQAVLHHQEGGAAGGGPQQGSCSSTIHDLAYYWPQYTPITAPADNPLMLFTFSKITGHAGTRLGWAIVEDKRIAMKMFEYIRVNTLGVSQDAQRRAFTLIRTIIDGYKKQEQEIKQHVNHHGEEKEEEEEEEDHHHHLRHDCSSTQIGSVNAERIGFVDIERIPTGSSDAPPRMPFFHYIQALLEERWRRIVSVLEGNSLFTLPVYDEAFCTFLGKAFRPNPAFLWLKCTNGQDCGELLLKYGIATREGPSFGVSSEFVRLSLLDRDPLFDLLLQRLASIR